MKNFYPFGTQYHRAPTPLPEEWAGDLKAIAKAGYTHVQYRPQWRWHERIRGECVWDDLDRLFDLAQKQKLRVILKPQLETAPDWVFSDLHGTRIGFYGVPITPFALGACYVGGWWPCFDNPQVVAAAAAFVEKLVGRYRQHPALWFYNAWNEPVSRPMGACQCPHSAESYRRWLRQRFGSIEKLNAYYSKAWTSFGTIEPPSAGDDYVEMFLWRQWAAAAVAEQVRFVTNAIRRVDAKAFVMVHTGLPNVMQDPACFASDDLLNAPVTDRYGTSFWIPLHPVTPLDHATPDFQSDWLRRVDPQYVIHEFYPNHAGWCQPPTPQTLNRHIWMAIAGGCSGFTFWQYRSERLGNETNGHGLRAIDGSPTPRSEVADGIAGVLKKHGARLAGTQRVRAKVALLYSRQDDLLGRIQMMPWGLADYRQVQDNPDYPYKRAIKGAHALYLAAGETVEWVVPGDDLAGISLLHVTGVEMIDAATAAWLKRFVKRGGKLIVEFPFACRDERTWVSPKRPMHNLQKLLGCSEADRIRMDQRVNFLSGESIEAKGSWIPLRLHGGKAIAHWEDGTVAAVQHGNVCTLSVSLSLSFTNRWDDPIRQVWRQVTGLKPTSDGLWVRRRRGKGCEIWFVFNVAPQAGKLELPGLPKAIWQDAGCMLQKRQLELQPGATWVAEFRSR